MACAQYDDALNGRKSCWPSKEAQRLDVVHVADEWVMMVVRVGR